VKAGESEDDDAGDYKEKSEKDESAGKIVHLAKPC
jgi:hypothetical protein